LNIAQRPWISEEASRPLTPPKTLRDYLSARNNRHEEVRIAFASGVNHVGAGVNGLGMPGQHDPAGVSVDIAPLYHNAQFLPRGKAGAGRPNFDIDRHRDAWTQFQLPPMRQPWPLRGRTLGVELAVRRAQPTECDRPVLQGTESSEWHCVTSNAGPHGGA